MANCFLIENSMSFLSPRGITRWNLFC